MVGLEANPEGQILSKEIIKLDNIDLEKRVQA